MVFVILIAATPLYSSATISTKTSGMKNDDPNRISDDVQRSMEEVNSADSTDWQEIPKEQQSDAMQDILNNRHMNKDK